MECQFCKSTLKTKYSLFTHQKTNKKCLNEQQKIKNTVVENKLTNCYYCKKSCSMPNLKGHLLVCKYKKQFDIEQEIKKKYEKNLEEIKKENEKKIKKIKKENEKNLEDVKKKKKKK